MFTAYLAGSRRFIRRVPPHPVPIITTRVRWHWLAQPPYAMGAVCAFSSFSPSPFFFVANPLVESIPKEFCIAGNFCICTTPGRAMTRLEGKLATSLRDAEPNILSTLPLLRPQLLNWYLDFLLKIVCVERSVHLYRLSKTVKIVSTAQLVL